MTFDPFLQATANPWLQGLGTPYGFTQSPYGIQQTPFGNISGIGLQGQTQGLPFGPQNALQNVLTSLLTTGSPMGQIGSPWTHHLFSQLAPQTWLGGQQAGLFGSPYGVSQFGSPYGGSQLGSPYGVSPLALLLPQLLQQSVYGNIPPQVLSGIVPHLLAQIGQPFVGSPMTGQNPIVNALLRTNPFLGGIHGGYPFV